MLLDEVCRLAESGSPRAVAALNRFIGMVAEGRWVTMNGNCDGDGCGGARVYIEDDGTPSKGPKALLDKMKSKGVAVAGRDSATSTKVERPKAEPDDKPDPSVVRESHLPGRWGALHASDYGSIGKMAASVGLPEDFYEDHRTTHPTRNGAEITGYVSIHPKYDPDGKVLEAVEQRKDARQRGLYEGSRRKYYDGKIEEAWKAAVAKASSGQSPKAMTFDEFSSARGVPRVPEGEPGTHISNSSVSASARKAGMKSVTRGLDDWQAKRDSLREEYDAQVKAGKIREPSTQEQVEQAASGDSESAAAARRVLEKRAKRRSAT